MARQYKVRGSVDSTFTIPVDYRFYNWTAAASLFSDEACTVPATATAGTIIVNGKIPGAAEAASFDTSPIDATDKSAFATAGTPLDELVISFSGITGATYAKVVVTGTEG
tara:strand:+ start:248 stop:577 length:330 start_codon:yes stop_codon:yes gene_type:complete